MQTGKEDYMISFQTFLDKLCRAVSQYYGDACRVEVNKVQKNNGVIYYGMTIMDRGSNLSPTIYMEELYRQYRAGEPLSVIAEKVCALYENNRVNGNIDMQFFLDFSQARDRIVYKLINYERNRSLLSDVPHIRFLDMALVCYCGTMHDVLGSITILIRRGMCRLWGTEEMELFALAKKNTPRILEAEITNIAVVMDEMEGETHREREESCMYVLTNKRKLFGAACMLYPHILRQFAGEMEANLYLLPSSVHEVILIPDKLEPCRREFERIVRDMNGSYVEPEEVLSDCVYYYDREKDEITC